MERREESRNLMFGSLFTTLELDSEKKWDLDLVWLLKVGFFSPFVSYPSKQKQKIIEHLSVLSYLFSFIEAENTLYVAFYWSVYRRDLCSFSSLAGSGYFLKICSSYVSLPKPRFRNMFSSLLDNASWLLTQFHHCYSHPCFVGVQGIDQVISISTFEVTGVPDRSSNLKLVPIIIFQVRKKLVKDWLPVLIVCKDNNASPLTPSNKPLYLDLEETFLRIISTLPMPDAQELLQQCLSFSTRNVEDCPHLVTAFNTWFRRATHPPQAQNLC